MPTSRVEAPSDGVFGPVKNPQQAFLFLQVLLHGLTLIERTSGVCRTITDMTSLVPYRTCRAVVIHGTPLNKHTGAAGCRLVISAQERVTASWQLGLGHTCSGSPESMPLKTIGDPCREHDSEDQTIARAETVHEHFCTGLRFSCESGHY